jgi:hypothetical protein
MCPGVDSASKNEYHENYWGWRRPVRKSDDLPPSQCRKSRRFRSLNLLEPQEPLQACSGKPLPLLLVVMAVSLLSSSSSSSLTASEYVPGGYYNTQKQNNTYTHSKQYTTHKITNTVTRNYKHNVQCDPPLQRNTLILHISTSVI